MPSSGFSVDAIILDLKEKQHACTRARASVQTQNHAQARLRRDFAEYGVNCAGEGVKQHISKYVCSLRSSCLCMFSLLIWTSALQSLDS